MNKIELLLAYEDYTWETEVVDCPDEINRDSLDDVQDWIVEKLYCQYPRTIFISVYNTDPQSELIDDEENDDDWKPRGYNEDE